MRAKFASAAVSLLILFVVATPIGAGLVADEWLSGWASIGVAVATLGVSTLVASILLGGE